MHVTDTRKQSESPNREVGTTVVYVYAITPKRKKPVAAPRAGIDGVSRVEALAVGEHVCWLSHVDAAEFGDELTQRMEDLEWLANAGVRHQQVVSALAAQGDLLPARFGTIFKSEHSLVADLKRRKRGVAAALKRVAGAEEWGVKVFVAPRAVATKEVRSGREYLQQKAAALQQHAVRQIDPEILKLVASLKKASVDWAAAGKVSGGQPNLHWQGSFLVRRSGRTAFNRVLRQFASKWKGSRTIECTGPWPPYSFVGRNGR